jgi:DNA-directed RNA polymerase alpha subunit
VEDAGESIFQAIEFSSEILLNTPLWEAHINANFILAQRSFCKFYCSYAKTEEEKKFLDTYFPRELKSKASDQSRHNITIEELDLSVRSFNVLKRANINTLGDLMRVERNQFLRFRGFGNKSAVEIVRKALMCGVKLTDSVMALYEECKSTATKPISDDI